MLVDERSKELTLGQARAFAATLSEDKKRMTGCHQVRRPGSDRFLGWFCPTQCGCCVWTPTLFCFAPFDLLIGLMFCNCTSAHHPNTYYCVDMKGNSFSVVPVDEQGTLAYFTENETFGGKGDSLPVTCYCAR